LQLKQSAKVTKLSSGVNRSPILPAILERGKEASTPKPATGGAIPMGQRFTQTSRIRLFNDYMWVTLKLRLKRKDCQDSMPGDPSYKRFRQ